MQHPGRDVQANRAVWLGHRQADSAVLPLPSFCARCLSSAELFALLLRLFSVLLALLSVSLIPISPLSLSAPSHLTFFFVLHLLLPLPYCKLSPLSFLFPILCLTCLRFLVPIPSISLSIRAHPCSSFSSYHLARLSRLVDTDCIPCVNLCSCFSFSRPSFVSRFLFSALI